MTTLDNGGMEAMTTAQLALDLASATVPCPFCHGSGLVSDVPEDGDTLTVSCAECHGTGQVFWLDPEDKLGLRERCPNWKLRHATERGCSYGCGVCQGRGWVPGGWEAFHNATLALPEVVCIAYSLSSVHLLDADMLTISKGEAAGLDGLLRALEKVKP